MCVTRIAVDSKLELTVDRIRSFSLIIAVLLLALLLYLDPIGVRESVFGILSEGASAYLPGVLGLAIAVGTIGVMPYFLIRVIKP